jgi:hypothetical protein
MSVILPLRCEISHFGLKMGPQVLPNYFHYLCLSSGISNSTFFKDKLLPKNDFNAFCCNSSQYFVLISSDISGEDTIQAFDDYRICFALNRGGFSAY